MNCNKKSQIREKKQLTLIKEGVIKFYRSSNEYGFLSNLYKSPILFEGREFPTVEHAYQFGKYEDSEIREWVMKAPQPYLVAIVSHSLPHWDVVSNWSEIKKQRMYEILKVKFKDPDLRKRLINTKNAVLVEDSSTDSIWGIGKKGTGRNLLGKLLMKVRKEIIIENINTL